MSAQPLALMLAALARSSMWVMPLALGLVSCATGVTVQRADLPVPSAASRPSSQAVAAQLQSTGPRGRLSKQQREQMLVQLGQQGGADRVNRHLKAMALTGDVNLHVQNQARLLVDGPATFQSMFEAIEAARQTVLLQSYIIDDSEIAQRLATLLARKRAQGVQVLMLYDAVGSIATSEAYFDGLRAAGIATCAFNPLNPLKRMGYWDISHRDHRKILAVDRQVGFVGGINISAVYSSGSFSRGRAAAAADPREAGWRDTQVRLQGSAATALDDLVRQTWTRQGCQGALPPAPKSATTKLAAGPHVVRIVPSSPLDESSRIYTLLLSAIDTAQHSIYLTMAYFAPGQDMIDALSDAARRGVDVQLVLPSVSDFAPVLHAGRRHYQGLLEAGVKLHELQEAVLHAKTAVIDGVVSTVGSSNMDWRSFVSNDEVNAVILGEDFGDTMTAMFKRDVEVSQHITPQSWAQRSWLQRSKEMLAGLFERVW